MMKTIMILSALVGLVTLSSCGSSPAPQDVPVNQGVIEIDGTK